jgi:hypothetical protein
MKFLLFLFLSISLSGCSTWEKFKASQKEQSQRTEQARQERARQKEEERKNAELAEEARLAALAPGYSAKEFLTLWGEPEYIDFMDGVYSAYYLNDGQPLFVFFKDKKVLGWKNDREGVEREQDRNLQKAMFNQAQEQRRREESARAWQALSNSLQQSVPKQTRCQSTSTGYGGVTTVCN